MTLLNINLYWIGGGVFLDPNGLPVSNVQRQSPFGGIFGPISPKEAVFLYYSMKSSHSPKVPSFPHIHFPHPSQSDRKRVSAPIFLSHTRKAFHEVEFGPSNFIWQIFIFWPPFKWHNVWQAMLGCAGGFAVLRGFTEGGVLQPYSMTTPLNTGNNLGWEKIGEWRGCLESQDQNGIYQKKCSGVEIIAYYLKENNAPSQAQKNNYVADFSSGESQSFATHQISPWASIGNIGRVIKVW